MTLAWHISQSMSRVHAASSSECDQKMCLRLQSISVALQLKGMCVVNRNEVRDTSIKSRAEMSPKNAPLHTEAHSSIAH